MYKKFIILIILFFFTISYGTSEIVGKGLICSLVDKPRISNYSDIIVFFNEKKEVELN